MPDIRCIIVEDEPLAAKMLNAFASQIPSLEIKGTFKNAMLAAEYLRDHAVDLIFLDIHLPKVKGFAFLRSIPSPPAVIVTTAYHSYAVEGFDLNVVDYLLKPFTFDRFRRAVAKASTAIAHARTNPDTRDHMYVTVRKKRLRVLFSEIVYVESQREYVRIVTDTGEVRSKMSTRRVEELLPPHRFKRVHRSFIVSVEKIRSFTAARVEVPGRSIPVGRGFSSVVGTL